MVIDMLSCATTGVTIAIPANKDVAATILKTTNTLKLFMHGTFNFIVYNT
jgi:hypothetical protein